MTTEVYSKLIGRVVQNVTLNKNRTDISGSDEMILEFSDGLQVKFWHEQDCCELVEIIDIDGDLKRLIGKPLLVAESVMSENVNPVDVEIPEDYQESFTWTFYKFATVIDSVTVRWYGSSNGYYSERVDISVSQDGGNTWTTSWYQDDPFENVDVVQDGE